MASRRRKRERPDADRGLAVENYPGLNRLFYGMSPHGYLRLRLQSLYLWVGNPGGMNDLLRAGVSFEEMSIALDEDPGEEDEEERRRAAVIECEGLLHHTAETVPRLYLVHSRFRPALGSRSRGSATSKHSRKKSRSSEDDSARVKRPTEYTRSST